MIAPPLDPIDRAIVIATQAGLPLTPQPYHEIGGEVGIPAEEVMARMRRLQETGVIRRIGVVPNHYALGYKANGMTVWDIRDDAVGELGRRLGALDFISHCYQRPRHLPVWPYNLFAMVHARTHQEVEDKVAEMAALLGDASRGHEILYSTRILKKTGMRIGEG
ncbi:MAG: Lrp/AsnC family transcriptional regulator [Rhodospirillales bacterium]|nr:Lrp/AsnC family transcriptional regulator [Rhodospirillales bacterium]